MGTPLRARTALVFLLGRAPFVCVQRGAGSSKVSGQVSGVVAVSGPTSGAGSEGARASVESVDGATAAVSISGSVAGVARVRIPLRVRSNVGYSLRASFLSADELTARLPESALSEALEINRRPRVEGPRLPLNTSAFFN